MLNQPRKRAVRTPQSLRQRAKAILARQGQDTTDMSEYEIHRLVYELRLHQIELNLQNEELRRAQEEIETARNRYADLYEFAPIGYFSLDADGVIVETNLTGTQLLGVPRSRLLQRRFRDFVAADADTQDTLQRHCQQILCETTPCTCNLWMHRQDGTPFYAQLKSLMRRDGEQGPLQWRLALIDLTTLREQAEAQLRRLALRQQQRQEQERKRMAREIHDELAQSLTILHIDLAWLTEQPGMTPEAQARLQAMLTQVDEIDQIMHRIAMELRPLLLDDLGLLAALEWQIEEIHRRTGLAYTLQLPSAPLPLDIDRSTVLFRIFQEALTNVIRHAKASQVDVRVTQDAQAVCLEVRDNGKGMTARQQAQQNAFGLLGMRERAKLWGGEVRISGQSGSGTTVTVHMPYGSGVAPGDRP
jgi:PAS domain S-box-containing protein